MSRIFPSPLPVTAVALTNEYLRAVDKITNPLSLTDYRTCVASIRVFQFCLQSAVYPDPAGPEANNNTSFHPGQADWAEDNLPSIAYQLNRTPENLILLDQGVYQCRNTDGSLRVGILLLTNGTQTPYAVADYPVLPDNISTKVSPFRVVQWMRLDPRIEWRDILARMPLKGRPKQNTLQMACLRWRLRFGMKSWRGTKGGSFHTSKEDEDVELLLSAQQLAANTTRGLTPGLSLGFSLLQTVPILTFKERQSEIQAAKNKRYFDTDQLSELSSSEDGEVASKKRKSRIIDRRTKRHTCKRKKAIEDSVEGGEYGRAVILAGSKPKAFVNSDGRLIVRNVIIATGKKAISPKLNLDHDVANEIQNPEGGTVCWTSTLGVVSCITNALAVWE